MNARERKAEILSAGDGCEAADTLANWMLEVFSGKCGTCRAEAAHRLAVDMLPLVRPDLFSRNKGGK
jgi:hypothetical protein